MKVSFRRFAYNVFFRFSPILIVILLELALRFLGLGESYLLFNESEDGTNYELNQHYYCRFMSEEQFPDVEILPQEIPVKKPDNTVRIFVIGDQTLCSAFPDINEKQIIPDFKDENGTYYDVIQLAVPFTNSFAVTRLVRCAGKYDADACVLVTGGNEFYGIPRKSAWMQDIDNYLGLSWYVTMKNHRFIQILERFIYNKKDPQTIFPPEDPDEWVVAYGSNTFLEADSYFSRNMKKIVKMQNCPVFLVSMPVNIKVSPYRSLFVDKELNDEDIQKECAILLDNADRFTLDRWINDLEAWEPETAIYHYCKAMIYEHENNRGKALEHYERALDLDGFRVRMNREQSNTLKNASLINNIELIDLNERINALSSNKLNIDRYFSDGITLNPKGRDIFVSQVRSALLDYFDQ